LDLALRGNDKDFTAIDRIKSGTVAQTEGTGQRIVLKSFHTKSRSMDIER
jgi:hypothetical protein